MEVRNTKDNELYAMKVCYNLINKIIRAVERYVESAKAEEYILKYLDARDHFQNKKIVKLYECFQRKQNYCMIFERV